MRVICLMSENELNATRFANSENATKILAEYIDGTDTKDIEMISTALVELQDQRETPMVPRWFSWFTIAGAVAIVTAAGPAFFKTGPFAYHGLLAFYMPVLVWGVYLNGNAVFMWLELSREQAARSTRVGASVSGAALASR